ncbi:MAG: glycosyltransferase family 4 protein [Phycisphaeraceae bacterium]|nr:MAG: glycosyltransferase family 4 protein [Phycisphaeraceae bacterium]
MTTLPNTIILTFSPGGSLTRWSVLGRIDRERDLLRGLLGIAPHIVFVARTGPRDAQIAAALQEELGGRIDAIALDEPDAELGPGRPPHERVLARLGATRRVVIQTLQLDDGGIARQLVNPLRRAGVQAALVARGGFIGSRVLAAECGPHAYPTVTAGVREHALCQQAQYVVGVSECMIDELCWRHGVNPARTRVIPHFIKDVGEPPERAKRDPGLVLTVGELTDTRGVDLVIRAMAAQADGVRERLQLVVVGDGPCREPLGALAGELGVRASLPGRLPHDEVMSLMRTCSIFVHVSSQRRLSRSLLEAMSHGCPVITSDIPEFDGLIDNGSTGIRVKPVPEAIAFAIASMADDQDWREMIGSSAADVARAKCALEVVISRTRAVYADALRIAPATVAPRHRKAG